MITNCPIRNFTSKLSDNSLASELVENRNFLKPIKIEDITIFMIYSRKDVTQEKEIKNNLLQHGAFVFGHTAKCEAR